MMQRFWLWVWLLPGLALANTNTIPLTKVQELARAFSIIKQNYVAPTNSNQLIDHAIRGMVEDLDPHSQYLDKDDMTDFQDDVLGEVTGIGVQLEVSGHQIKVISPIDNSPAQQAGIIPGDIIVAVNQKSIRNHNIHDLLREMRGRAGQSLVLQIKRYKKGLLEFHLKRRLVHLQSVRGQWLAHQLYYIRITQFQQHTLDELAQQLKHLQEAPQGVIVDLRNNPGGLLNEAVGVVGVFEPLNTLVCTLKGQGDQEVFRVDPQIYKRDPSAPDPLIGLPVWTKSVPMVVLINAGSASASELVAGALQDQNRAKILGVRSFGKGSVQSVFSLGPDSAIKITTARYYTPKGRVIQLAGIKPDIPVSDTPYGNIFGVPREVDLPGHLDQAPHHTGDDQPATAAAHPFVMGAKDDFQLQQAQHYLLHQPVAHGR